MGVKETTGTGVLSFELSLLVFTATNSVWFHSRYHRSCLVDTSLQFTFGAYLCVWKIHKRLQPQRIVRRFHSIRSLQLPPFGPILIGFFCVFWCSPSSLCIFLSLFSCPFRPPSIFLFLYLSLLLSFFLPLPSLSSSLSCSLSLSFLPIFFYQPIHLSPSAAAFLPALSLFSPPFSLRQCRPYISILIGSAELNWVYK